MDEELLELVKLVQNGNQNAFEELYKRSYHRAYKVALRAMHKDVDAQDVVQEAFIEVQRSLQNLRDPKLYHAWLHRVVTSKANDMYYKRRHYGDYSDHMARIQKENRNYMLPDKKLSVNEDQKVIRKLINELKPKYREIMYLYYFEQQKIDDIAVKLDLPSGTVKSRMSRAKEMLAHRISLYEKQEGRKLDFNLDGITTLSTGASIWYTLKYMGMSTLTSTPMMIGVCFVLTISSLLGGQEIYHNMQEETPIQNMEQKFKAITYHDRVIKDSKTAYFICLSWAENEEDMKDKTKSQYRELQPIYETLKEQENEYYRLLKQHHWAETFEKYLNEYNL